MVGGSEVRTSPGALGQQAVGRAEREPACLELCCLKGTGRLGWTTYRLAEALWEFVFEASSVLQGHSGAHWPRRGPGTLVGPKEPPLNQGGTRPDKDGSPFLARMVSFRILETQTRCGG